MKSIIFMAFVAIILVIISCSSGKIKKMDHNIVKDPKFTKEWKDIENLENNGLFKSALSVVDSIYDVSSKDGIIPQKIKSLFYKGKYTNVLAEDNLIAFEELLRNEIQRADQPEKSILQSILAQFYSNYLDAHIWQIRRRTEIMDDSGNDIQTWSPGRFIAASNRLYDESILFSGLKNVSFSEYEEIFSKPQITSNLRQTLYGILVQRSLDHYKNDRNYLPKSTDLFMIDKKTYFSMPDNFIKISIESAIPDDPKYKTLQLYQEMEKNGIDTGNNPELIDISLNRLQFVKSQYLFEDGDEIYISALKKMMDRYSNYNGIAEAYFLLAQAYAAAGESDADDSKWKLKEALEICDEAIAKYPGSAGAAACNSLKSEILRKEIRITTEQVNLSDETLLMNIQFKNIDRLHCKLIRLSDEEQAQFNSLYRDQDVFINKLMPLRSWDISIPDDGDFRAHTTETGIENPGFGTFLLVCSDSPSFTKEKGIVSYQVFHVSDLAYWLKHENTDSYVFVVNRKTGAPVENATVQLFTRRWNNRTRSNDRVLFTQAQTNKDGFIKLDRSADHQSYEIVVSKDNDKTGLNDHVYSYIKSEPRERKSVVFFSDRSIYRPGQTIYYKGLMINYDKQRMPSAVKNERGIRLEFLDANRQKVSEATFSTNDFGTFNGSFTIPLSGLTGTMYLRETTTNSEYSFRVEEYKRPKFEVSFSDYTGEYKLGDTIEIEGLAASFSGFPLQNAQVVYTVKRKVIFPFYSYRRPPFRSTDLEISRGMLSTDENGNFSIPVELFVSDLKLDRYNPRFVFEVKADVTDITGETHSASKSISASTSLVNITLEIPERIRDEKELNINIFASNNSGQKTKAEGTVKVIKLKEPAVLFRKRLWSTPDTFMYSRNEFYRIFPNYAFKTDDNKRYWDIESKISEFPFNTETSDTYAQKLQAGEYKIILEYTDPDGKKTEMEKFVSVHSDTKNPANTILLTETDKNYYDVPSEMNVRWQSHPEDLHVHYSVWERNGNIIDKSWLKLNKSAEKKFKLTEEHRGGLILSGTYIYNNRFYENTTNVNIPWSDRQLNFEYMSFRSKLYPGQDEEWRVTVKGENASVFMTEVLASMYDMSLDKIHMSEWTSSIPYPNVSYQPSIRYGFGTSGSRLLYPRDHFRDRTAGISKSYRDINWFGFSVLSMYGGSDYLVRSRAKSRAPVLAESAVPEEDGMVMESMDEMIVEEQQSIEADDTKSSLEEPDKSGIQLRENLNETVFFYPELRTDENGEFVIAFKMNEALTKWKLRLFAHTADLKFGYDEKEIVTQKDLMITPNNPRFVRRGDELRFNIRIDNLSGKALSGDTWLELFDAATMQPVDGKILSDERNKAFTISEKGSAYAGWEMKFTGDIPDLIIYRFYAKAGEFSDGEEGLIPVLTNQKLVTESIPLWVRGNETRSFTLNSLVNSGNKDLKNISYTIESTSHPVWLCIQSLPYIREVKFENTISISNALFSNMLSSKISEDNPAIKRVFDAWQSSGKKVDREAMLSALRKNQELKNILLDETPWVLDALDEEEQIRNIALLFDVNQANYDQRNFINKLKAHQNPDGGFPWFSRGRSNRYISQYVLETFGKIRSLGININIAELKPVLDKNIIYVNEEVVKDYKKLLELAAQNKIKLDEYQPGSMDIHYLYAIQQYPEAKIDAELKIAIDFYTAQTKKYWNRQALYLKAMTALVLHRANDKKTAQEIMRAIEEQSVYSEELGRYWKEYHGFNWWQLPIETQSMIIEAFSETESNTKIIDELKIWLLKNRQTNRWKTAKASVAAIHALLRDDTGILLESKPVVIYIDNKNITAQTSSDEFQAGTAYFKRRWPGSEVKPSMGNVRLENPNQGIAWGAVYWQYLQDFDKIEGFEEAPLKIRRELYVVEYTSSGEKIKLINPGDKIKPGDMVRVRLRLEVDRPMEFVHLSDQRAAAFEPIDQTSSYAWQGGLGYYQNPRDSKMNFFIDQLSRGVYVLEYSLRAVQSGTFSNGIAELQSYYAPEFSSHSDGLKVTIE